MATFTIQDRYYSCPVELTLSVVAGKWKILILWHLRGATLRFSELRGAMPDITDKMLSQQLRELEEEGLIHREVYPVVPPKTEYSLTAERQRMVPVLTAMQQWGWTTRSARGRRRGPHPAEQQRLNRRSGLAKRTTGRLQVRPCKTGLS